MYGLLGIRLLPRGLVGFVLVCMTLYFLAIKCIFPI